MSSRKNEHLGQPKRTQLLACEESLLEINPTPARTIPQTYPCLDTLLHVCLPVSVPTWQTLSSERLLLVAELLPLIAAWQILLLFLLWCNRFGLPKIGNSFLWYRAHLYPLLQILFCITLIASHTENLCSWGPLNASPQLVGASYTVLPH